MTSQTRCEIPKIQFVLTEEHRSLIHVQGWGKIKRENMKGCFF
jgi:hypothetical protein